ncbi:hypothetical protein [Gracilibacillus massiliensis]|uniref:hypothetical protein n=1 Tax=Gracilibacillus massiliensis TaxID=1564956 RepID=UPI00071C517F|nr:hypothetical protein [Gracilibacillus massiliensis]
MKKIITTVTVIALFAFAMMVVNQPQMDQAQAQETPKAHATKSNELKSLKMDDIKQMTQKEANLSHEQIVTLTDKFMELLVQDIDDHYKVEQFDTKQELIKVFDPYVKQEVVQPYIDFYYKEKEDGLYIVPTETPAWFVKDAEYEKEQKDGKITVTQTNENALHGKYTIVLTFEKIDETWKIVNISHE